MENEERIARITEMEERLNRIKAWLSGELTGSIHEDICVLEEYYTSLIWISDFEADEAGELPDNLKRGVLSEDDVYNVLIEYGERMQNSMKEERDWATPTLKEVPFWREGMSPEEYDIERAYYGRNFHLVRERKYKPLWKQKQDKGKV